MRHDFAWHRKCALLSGHCCSEELANNTANTITISKGNTNGELDQMSLELLAEGFLLQ